MSKKDRKALDRVMKLVFTLDMAEPLDLAYHGERHHGRTVARAVADDIREAIAGNPRKQGLHSLNRLGLTDHSKRRE